MTPQPVPPSRPGTPVWVWVVVALGAACFLCGGAAVGLMALGAVASDDTPASGPRPAGPSGVAGPSRAAAAPAAPYQAAASVQRNATLDQPLVGRWLYMTGSNLERVLSEGTYSRVVEVSSSGQLHELVFDEDGSYRWVWLSVSNYLIKTKGWASERGTWRLDGTTLTLTPSTWEAEYTAGTTQHREDENLVPRGNQAISIVLETFELPGQQAVRFPGINISGTPPPWSLEEGAISLDLQRQ